MKVKLLRQHFIDDRLHERDEILEVSVVTPYMEGLDLAAREAIKQEKIRVFGRWIDPYNHARGLIDDPPIERPLEENQPIRRLPAQGP